MATNMLGQHSAGGMSVKARDLKSDIVVEQPEAPKAPIPRGETQGRLAMLRHADETTPPPPARRKALDCGELFRSWAFRS